MANYRYKYIYIFLCVRVCVCVCGGGGGGGGILFYSPFCLKEKKMIDIFFRYALAYVHTGSYAPGS